jgi:type VI secretion system VasD/TssJ family lipoprotein
MWPRLVLGILLTISGCPCQKPEPPPPPPVYDLCLEGAPHLNWYQQQPHTLFTRVFQLSSVEAFARTDAQRLLDPQIQLQGAEGPVADRTVYPGAKTTLSLTKQPNAEFVGIVAAYYRLDGSTKVSLPLKALTGAACVQLGANGIDPLPVGPQAPGRAQ